MFNLIYTHLLNKTEHSSDCHEGLNGIVCATDCSTQRFLDWLEEPLLSWEVEEEARLRQRRKDLMRGIIPA